MTYPRIFVHNKLVNSRTRILDPYIEEKSSRKDSRRSSKKYSTPYSKHRTNKNPQRNFAPRMASEWPTISIQSIEEEIQSIPVIPGRFTHEVASLEFHRNFEYRQVGYRYRDSRTGTLELLPQINFRSKRNCRSHDSL